MSNFNEVIDGARESMLSAFIVKELKRVLHPEFSRRGGPDFERKDLEEILRCAEEYAAVIGIQEHGMSDGAVEGALKKALKSAIHTLSADDPTALVSKITGAFVRGDN